MALSDGASMLAKFRGYLSRILYTYYILDILIELSGTRMDPGLHKFLVIKRSGSLKTFVTLGDSTGSLDRLNSIMQCARRKCPCVSL